MNVQGLLSAAYVMYKRHFSALVLSSLLLFAVCFAVALVFMLVFTATLGALIYTNIVVLLVVSALVWFIAGFIGDIVGITFSGGQYRMLILAEREQRVARVSDLWSALRYMPSLFAWAVVVNVLALVCFLAIFVGGWLGLKAGSNAVAYIFMLAAVAGLYWVLVRWIWVIPSIGDSGVSLIAAMKKSSLIVGRVGWWRTFGLLLVVLGINLVVYLVCRAVFAILGDVLGLPGLLTALVALAPLIVFLAPYETCFLTCMYRFSQVYAGLPDTFEPSPVAVAGGTGQMMRDAFAQVGEAARDLKGAMSTPAQAPGASGVAPVYAAPPAGYAPPPAAAPAPAAGAPVASPEASVLATFCGKCGTPRNGQARFCGQCGAGLERPASA